MCVAVPGAGRCSEVALAVRRRLCTQQKRMAGNPSSSNSAPALAEITISLRDGQRLPVSLSLTGGGPNAPRGGHGAIAGVAFVCIKGCFHLLHAFSEYLPNTWEDIFALFR